MWAHNRAQALYMEARDLVARANGCYGAAQRLRVEALECDRVATRPTRWAQARVNAEQLDAARGHLFADHLPARRKAAWALVKEIEAEGHYPSLPDVRYALRRAEAAREEAWEASESGELAEHIAMCRADEADALVDPRPSPAELAAERAAKAAAGEAKDRRRAAMAIARREAGRVTEAEAYAAAADWDRMESVMCIWNDFDPQPEWEDEPDTHTLGLGDGGQWAAAVRGGL